MLRLTFDLNWDLKIWVETPKDICLKRGLEKDKDLGERAAKAWQEVWQPQEDTYIRQTNPQDQADIAVDGTRSFEGQI